MWVTISSDPDLSKPGLALLGTVDLTPNLSLMYHHGLKSRPGEMRFEICCEHREDCMEHVGNELADIGQILTAQQMGL